MKEIKLTEELSYLLYDKYNYVLLSDGKHKEIGFNDITEIISFLRGNKNHEDYEVYFVYYNNSNFDDSFEEIKYLKVELVQNCAVSYRIFKKEIKSIYYNK